ncbi:hypothetical protein [Frondihabitans sp. PAMC 28766]|uniref:hypothetical protein n=1 Tax=Frondihabitans sp. PAMC 28766 TaxID=1795630 RepID=UPI001950B050|nr:hypothetical protein [Frondihabitans sp. PAMC 28766]
MPRRVEPPELSRPSRPLDAEDHTAAVPRQHRVGHDRAGQTRHRGARPRGGVEQLQLAAAGHVPDEEENAPGVVGVEVLELAGGVRREHLRGAAPPVRADGHRDELPPGQAGLGREVGDQRAGLALG